MTGTNDLTAAARGYLPLSDAVFHLMLCLADGPAHGYGVLQEVESRSDGAVRMGTGTLYSAVKRLRDQGLIEEVPTPADDDDPRRRYYGLTALGSAVLREQAFRLESLVGFARNKAVIPGGPGL